MEKFSYQIVYKLKEEQRIIYTGVTSSDISFVLDRCNSHVNRTDADIESVVFQPLKVNDDVKEK